MGKDYTSVRKQTKIATNWNKQSMNIGGFVSIYRPHLQGKQSDKFFNQFIEATRSSETSVNVNFYGDSYN
jgi:hypothetical protein